MKPSRRIPARSAFAARLAGYSATALAGMAAAPAAHATVQNITSLTLNGNPSGPLVVNFEGSANTQAIGVDVFAPFQLSVKNNSNTGGIWVTGNSHFGFSTMAAKLGGGANLNRNFNGGRHVLALYTQHSSQRDGSWRFGGGGQTTGYLAFEAINAGKTYVGWLRVQVQNSGRGFANQFALLAKDGEPTVFGAFDLASSAAADGFAAGVVAVPEPSVAALSGLSLLALGAAGVREMRRRRQTGAAAEAGSA